MLEDYYNMKKDKGVINIEEIVELSRTSSVEYDLTLPEVAEIQFQVREYHRYYEDENIVPVFVEQPFIKLIYEDEDMKIFLTGKPDLIFRYSHSPQLCVMDHKSMRREYPYSPLRNQFLLYTTAMETDTFILNKVGFQKSKKPKDRFIRVPFLYKQAILDEWKEDLVNRAREMLIAQEMDYYPRNRTSCEKFNGCYLQRYCATRPAAREFLIGHEYIVGETWDVSGELEKQKTNEENG